MNNQAEILAQVFDDKTVRILKKILEKENIIYLRELSKETGVSLATTFRIIQHFLKLGLVEKQTQGKFKFYKINKNSNLFKELNLLILGKKILSPMRILKEEFPNKKIFQSKNNPNEFFIISKEDINIKEVISKIKNKTGIKIKLNILDEFINQP